MEPLFTCIYTVDEIPALSAKIFDFILKNNIHLACFYGDLGSGKTTFFQGIMKHISPDLIATSPTYTYVNEYRFKDRFIWHFDLYRVQNQEELIDLGLIDYFSRKDGISFVEWPEKIEDSFYTIRSKLILTFHHTKEKNQRALVVYKN